jgi:hypothetical protein
LQCATICLATWILNSGFAQRINTDLGFVVPYIFKYSYKTSNQMQQSIVTFNA